MRTSIEKSRLKVGRRMQIDRQWMSMRRTAIGMRELLGWLSRQIARAGFSDRVSVPSFKRRLPAVAISMASIVLTGLGMIFASPAHAQNSVRYMIIPGTPIPPNVSPSSSNLASGGTYDLPGYGSVEVTWTPQPSTLHFNTQDQPLAERKTAGNYTWTSPTRDINVLNLTGGFATYIVTFKFPSGQPDLNNLLLTVIGLASDSTATVSQKGILAGQFQFPGPPASCPTVLTGGDVIGSEASASPCADLMNTGWALFKIEPATTLPLGVDRLPFFTVQFSQRFGDGIGFTLGYVDSGLLKMCKVAGPGVAVGKPITFTAAASNGDRRAFKVPAGPAPGGTCVMGKNFPVGTNVTVTEDIAGGHVVSSIEVAPPDRLVDKPDLAAGSTTVKIGRGLTEVTFTDKRSGFVEICRSTGGWYGWMTGSPRFIVNPGGLGPFAVPAGACSPAIEVAAGAVTIEEVGSGNTIIAECTTIPFDRQGGCTPRSSTVTVVLGDVSTTTIANITSGIFIRDFQRDFQPTMTFNGTTTTLACEPTAASARQPVTCTAKATPTALNAATPTGAMRFSEGTTTLAEIPLSPDDGTAVFTTSALAPGTHTIAASYGGDAAFDPSGSEFTLTVQP